MGNFFFCDFIGKKWKNDNFSRNLGNILKKISSKKSIGILSEMDSDKI